MLHVACCMLHMVWGVSFFLLFFFFRLSSLAPFFCSLLRSKVGLPMLGSVRASQRCRLSLSISCGEFCVFSRYSIL